MDNYRFLRTQEVIYHNSIFLSYKWYRKLFGGKWFYIDLTSDSPIICICIWTKYTEQYSGYNPVVKTESYKETGADTSAKLFKQFIKNIFNK